VSSRAAADVNASAGPRALRCLENVGGLREPPEKLFEEILPALQIVAELTAFRPRDLSAKVGEIHADELTQQRTFLGTEIEMDHG
jgi:hypothetical protein